MSKKEIGLGSSALEKSKKAWEYRRIAGNNLDELNRYGREGWEVIALEGREVLMKREIVPPVLEQV